jgi:mannosyltransferase
MKWLRQHWMITGILILAFMMRLPLLAGSFWLDEAAQILESIRPFSEQIYIKDDFQPPLIHFLVHFLSIFSHSEWWLRMGAALIPGLVTIWGSYWLGKKWFSERVGVLTALLLATSSFHIFYSQELRPYSLPTMFAVLSWIMLEKMSESKKFSWKLVVGFGLFTLAGFYSSYLYPFLFFAQIVWVVAQRRKLMRQVIGTAVAVGVGFAIWIPKFVEQLHAGELLRKELPGWDKVVSFTQLKAISLIVGKFLFGVLDLEFSAAFFLIGVLLTIVGAFVLWHFLQKEKLTKVWAKFGGVIIWLVVPVLTAWLVSFFVPVLQAKRVLYCLPVFYLIIAAVGEAVFDKSKNRAVQKSAILFIALFLIINVWSSFSYYFIPKYHREDWRGTYQYITEHYSPGSTVVVFAFPNTFAPWMWYNTSNFPESHTGNLVQQIDYSDRIKKLTDYKYILVFDYLRDLTDPRREIDQNLRKYGFQEVDTINSITPLGQIHVYSRPSSVVGMNFE